MIYYYFMVDGVKENKMFKFLEATPGISISVVLMYYSSQRKANPQLDTEIQSDTELLIISWNNV